MDELNVEQNEHFGIPKSGDVALDAYIQNLGETKGVEYLKAVITCAKLGLEICAAPEKEKKDLIDRASMHMALLSLQFEGDGVAAEIMKESKELCRIGRLATFDKGEQS